MVIQAGQSQPEGITTFTDRLFLLLHHDTQRLTEEEIAARTRR
jgi:hypothetical protein